MESKDIEDGLEIKCSLGLGWAASNTVLAIDRAQTKEEKICALMAFAKLATCDEMFLQISSPDKAMLKNMLRQAEDIAQKEAAPLKTKED